MSASTKITNEVRDKKETNGTKMEKNIGKNRVRKKKQIISERKRANTVHHEANVQIDWKSSSWYKTQHDALTPAFA